MSKRSEANRPESKTSVIAPDGLTIRDARADLIPHLEKLGLRSGDYKNLRVFEYGDGTLTYDFGDLSDDDLHAEALYVSPDKLAEHIYESVFPQPDETKYATAPNW
jgi:hypothetical protein